MDPDTYRQLEKFRKVQGHVKTSKARLRHKNDIQAIHEYELFSCVLVFGLVLCSFIFAHNLSFGSVGLFFAIGKAN